MVSAAALSTVGLITHNLAEFPPRILLRPETLGPVAVTALLLLAWPRLPSRRLLLLLSTWAALHLFVGGPSVFPIPWLPFEPEQTVGHYAAHAVYVAAQLPLLWLPVRQAVAGR